MMWKGRRPASGGTRKDALPCGHGNDRRARRRRQQRGGIGTSADERGIVRSKGAVVITARMVRRALHARCGGFVRVLMARVLRRVRTRGLMAR